MYLNHAGIYIDCTAPFYRVSLCLFFTNHFSYLGSRSCPFSNNHTNREKPSLMAGKSEARRHNRAKPGGETGRERPKKAPLTHFLCLPLVNATSRSQLQNALARFAQDDSGAGSVFHKKAIRPLGALHFTIGVMSLAEKERLDGAIQMIRNLDIHDMLDETENEISQGLESTKVSEAVNVKTKDSPQNANLVVEPANKAKEQAASEASSNETGSSEKFRTDSQVVHSTAETEWMVESLSNPPLSSLTRPHSPPPWPRPALGTSESLPKKGFIARSPLKLQISGLHPMKSPSKTSVLYATAEDVSARLLPFTSAVRKSFTEAGFLIPDDRPLKLHATIVNTIYAKEGHPRARRRRAEKPAETSERILHDNERDGALLVKQESGKESGKGSDGEGEKSEEDLANEVENTPDAEGQRKQQPLFQQYFNAMALVEKYKDFVWAKDVHLDRLAICEMGTKKVYDEHGRFLEEKYTEVVSVSLP